MVTAGGRHEEVNPFSAILPLKILSLLQKAKVISNPYESGELRCSLK